MFSLVIPTFNERDNIKVLVPKIVNLLSSTSMPFEIIVVDDNSPDCTWEAVEEMMQTFPQLRLIRRFNEKGLSSAVVTGFEAAKGDLYGVIDADLQHDENILPQMLKEAEHANIVVASRYIQGGGTGDWNFLRKAMSKFGTSLANYLLEVPLSDPLSGFFIIRGAVFDSVGDRLNPKGFKILLEILNRSKEKNVREVPFVFRNRLHGVSKLEAGVGIDYLLTLYDLMIGSIFPIQFLQFCIVGLIGVGVNLFILALLMRGFLVKQDQALICAISISMVSNYLINNVWTFGKQEIRGFLPILKGLFRFILICAIGAFVNFSCTTVLNEKLDINLYLANLVGIGIASVWNFRLSEKLIWKN